MNRLFSLIMCCVIALCATACNASGTSVVTTTTTASTVDGTTFAADTTASVTQTTTKNDEGTTTDTAPPKNQTTSSTTKDKTTTTKKHTTTSVTTRSAVTVATTTTTETPVTTTAQAGGVDTSSIQPFGTEQGEVVNSSRVFESTHFTFRVSADVYLPPDLTEIFEKLYGYMQTATGLSFKESVDSPKITVKINREGLSEDPVGSSESGRTYAQGRPRIIQISPGHLPIGHNAAVIHELAHILQYDNCSENFSTVLCEGFSTYTADKVLRYLYKNDKEFAQLFGWEERSFLNLEIYNYDELYKHPITYWFENELPIEYSHNQNYSIGFRLLSYLDTVYGDYTAWLSTYRERYLENAGVNSTEQPIDKQIQAITDAYGDTVLESFYPWLKQNEKRFAAPREQVYEKGTRWIHYPQYIASGYRAALSNVSTVTYNDLTVSLLQMKDYFTRYKQEDYSQLKLKRSNTTPVVLYDENGKFLRVSTAKVEPIADAAFIRFLGEGTDVIEFKLQ